MPFEIVVETEIQEQIMKGIKSNDIELSNTYFLQAIAMALQESMKIQRDILSILESWEEDGLPRSKQNE